MGKQLVFILFFFLNLLIHNAYAYNLKQVADKEYMSNSSITSLCQDERGLMWIGTCDGLNIYDGQEIEEFKTRDKEDYLSGNLIDNIVYTGEDIYWIQTYYGLNRLNRKTNTITHYNEFQKLFFMNKDSHGNLFIIQDSNCIYYYHKKEGVFKKINITGIPISDIVNFFIDGNNRMWVVMKGYNRCYDIQQEAASGDITLLPQKTNLIYQTSLIYCFNDEQSLYYIDKEFNFYAFHIPTQKNEFIANLGKEIQERGKISSIVHYHNSYFVGFLMDGILLLEKQKETNHYQIQSLPINSGVFCLKKDRFQDVVWIGTDGQGVYLYSNPLYSIKSMVLSNYTEKIERPVRAIYLDDERTFWVGTKGNGILKIYDYEFDKNISDCRAEVLTTSNSALSSNAVYCFAKSHRNLLWIGDEEGLTYYSYREKRIKSIPIRIGNEDFKYIHGIYETADSELWLASVGMGVVKARIAGTPDNPVIVDAQRYIINDGELGSNYFFTIYAENEANLLFGNKGYGVFRYNETTNGLEPVSTHKYENMTLNNILAISKDSSNNYLFGTSYGLIKYTSETSYQLFNAKNGFLNNTIHAILRSSSDNFWLSTNLGLINFDTKRNVFRSYGFGDGLKVVEFSDGAAFRDSRTGTLFFGGINGVVAIRADGRPEQLYMPPVYFDKLSIFGEQYNLGEFLTRKKETEVLNLQYDQNFFSVSFASVDYLNGNNCTYFYKLKGLSDQWVNNGSESGVSFTNMAPGEYTLLVKYYNSVFDKESDVYSLVIRIGDPWYASWWAYLIYALCLLLLAALLIRSFILRSKRKKQELLNEIEKRHQKNVFESKLRFFTNISHEFRTPLTLIVGQVETLLQVQTFTPNIYNKVLGIYKNSLQLRELITELLDFRKQEQGHMKIKTSKHNLVEFLYENYLLFLEYASSKQINFNFIKQTDDIEVWYDQKQMQKVINNLLSNALKHTKAEDTITIKVSQEQDHAIIEIKDTGSGIAAAEIDKIFDRFYQTEHLDSLNTGAGTGIGLALTKGIVELHHGTIRVESEPGKGSSFIITLKLGNQHFTEEQIVKEDVESTIQQPTDVFVPSVEVLPDTAWKEEENNKRIEDAKMLIVEDNESIKQMLVSIFETFYQVTTASDGEEALEKVREEMPSIILSDVVMPRMSGTELCKRIKTDFNTCHIPVVLLTARTAIEHNIEGLKIGADDYITKPFNTNLLISRCNNLVNSRRLLQEKFSKQPQAFAQMLATNPMDKEMLDRAMAIIERHLDNPDFNVNIFAREMGMARTNLFTKLKAVTGQTPNDFILSIRLKKGAVMLRNNPELNITEISDRIGFSSSRYFSKCFKEIYHVSPLAYRKGEEKEEGEEETA